MGSSQSSAPKPTLDQLDPEEQRNLMRNVQVLNSRNTAHPGKFTYAEFREVHATMPTRLAAALWRGLAGSKAAAADAVDDTLALDLDAVVQTVVPLKLAATASSAETAQAAHFAACFPAAHAASGASVALEDAAAWLASVGEPASTLGGGDAAARGGGGAMSGTGTGTGGGGAIGGAASSHAHQARLLAEATCAAWLLDVREREPLPVLAEGTTRLLVDAAHVRFLSRALPTEQRRTWRLLFTTARDGCSFTRFVALTANRAPCLVVIRDRRGALFGGFAAAPLSVSPKFGGSYSSFLFALGSERWPRQSTLYRASGDSGSLVYLNHGMEQLCNGLAFGGSLEASYFGLWLRDDFEGGRSDGPCATYGNSPCLAASAEFELDELEIWAVEEDPPPPSEEELASMHGENALTAAGVLSSKHEETKNFLAMAGRKTQHAERA